MILLAEKKFTYLVVGISPYVSNIISDKNYYTKKVKRGSETEQKEEKRRQKNKLKILTNFGMLFKTVVKKVRRDHQDAFPDEKNLDYFYPGFDTQAIEIQKEMMKDFVETLNETLKNLNIDDYAAHLDENIEDSDSE